MFRELPPRAPETPRAITPDIEADTKHVGRMLRIFGTIWTAIDGGFTLVTAIVAIATGATQVLLATALCAFGTLVGVALLLAGRKRRTDAIAVFRDGVEVEAEVVSVVHDKSVRVNGKSPWRIAYRYDVAGRTHRGSHASWTDEKPQVAPGAKVIALHDASRPSRSVLWTRILPTADAPRIRVDADTSVPEEDDAEAAIDEGRRGRADR